MISDLWTLEPSGQPGLARPLADLGIEAATLARANQAPATLSLSMPAPLVETDLSTWAWDSSWTLRRGGEIEFRGRVATPPDLDASAVGEHLSIGLSDAWAELAETPYMQEWDTLTASGIQSMETPRARLGWQGKTTTSETTTQALAKVVAAASRRGLPLTLVANLPALPLPPMEAGNQSCADLVRAILRYHPGATATIVSTAAGEVLLVTDRSLAGAATLPATGRPVAAVRLRPRPDLVVSSVHLHYTSSATNWTESPPEGDDPPGLVARRGLAVFRDVFPAGAAANRRSMVVELPAGDVGGETSPPPTPHSVPVKTRALPKTGDASKAAEKFWLDLLGLTALGIKADDVVLPPSNSAAAQPHRVQFAWAVDDPDDPLGPDVPSAINPRSKPLWRPPSVDRLPRMLVAGQLAEWMGVKAAEVVVDATLGVKKSAVDALPEKGKEAFMRLNPELGKVGGQDAYRLYRPTRLIATTARTKVYRNWAATAAASPQASLAESLEAARKEAVVPGLAQRLWAERSQTPWEGTLTLAAEECGGERWLRDRVLNLSDGRPEWADMRAVVQGEELDIGSGRTTLTLGPPEHLSPQDHAELFMAARRSRTARAEAAQIQPPPASGPPDEGDWEQPGRGGVYPPTVTPKMEPVLAGGGGGAVALPWDLEAAPDGAEGAMRLVSPRVYQSREDVDGSVTVTNTPFVPASGKWLLAVMEGLNPTAVTVALESGWPGFPSAFEFDGTGSYVRARIPLWKFGGAETPGSVEVADGVWATKLCPSHRLRMVFPLHQVPGKAEYRTVVDLI